MGKLIEVLNLVDRNYSYFTDLSPELLKFSSNVNLTTIYDDELNDIHKKLILIINTLDFNVKEYIASSIINGYSLVSSNYIFYLLKKIKKHNPNNLLAALNESYLYNDIYNEKYYNFSTIARDNYTTSEIDNLSISVCYIGNLNIMKYIMGNGNYMVFNLKINPIRFLILFRNDLINQIKHCYEHHNNEPYIPEQYNLILKFLEKEEKND